MAIVAEAVILVMPRYQVLQDKRSISIMPGVNDDFVISPAKVRITNLLWGESVTIPVKVSNGEGATTFVVSEENPSKFDNGYMAPDENCGYRFVWNKSVMPIRGNSSDTLNVTITKTARVSQQNIEKGIAITQTTNEKGISIVRSYVFEILN